MKIHYFSDGSSVHCSETQGGKGILQVTMVHSNQ